MKRFITALLIAAFMLSAVACGNTNPPAETTDPVTTEAPETDAPAVTEPAVNEGTFKAGVYTATSSYSTEGMSMTWNFVLTFNADGTFVLKNDAGDSKGDGTYALAGDHYEMKYSDDRVGQFVVTADGKLKMIADMPFGMATIQLALVGDIIFTFSADVAADTTDAPATDAPAADTTVYTVANGSYYAEYEKVSAMAGTVVYKYFATVDSGVFTYTVSFAMGGQEMAGSNGAYALTADGNKLILTATDGTVIEGKITAENTFTVSLKASAMATDPYEVTFSVAPFNLAPGYYYGEYEKVSAMAGNVLYNYTAVLGEDGSFSYSVKFAMSGQEMDGVSAKGTYKAEGNKFTFTAEDGTVTVGELVDHCAIKISLKASAMATEPYEITLRMDEH